MTKKTATPDTLWRKLYEHLHARIVSGDLADGVMLPSEMELCETHDMSRITIRRSLRELEVIGLLKRQRGAGTVVVAPKAGDEQRLIHLVMCPTGHVLSDIHQSLMRQLGSLQCSHRTWTPEAANVDDVAAVPARGVLVVPWNIDTSAFHAQAKRFKRVVSIVPNASEDLGFPGFGITFEEPIRAVVQRARDVGITSIIHVTYFHQSLQRDAVSHAVVRACLDLGMSFSVIARFDRGTADEFEELHNSLKTSTKPVLLLCASDFIALKTKPYAVALNRRIPQDISIIGIFDTPHSQAVDMSTISVRPDDLVKGALDLIFNNVTTTEFTRLPGTMIIRGTGPGEPTV